MPRVRVMVESLVEVLKIVVRVGMRNTELGTARSATGRSRFDFETVLHTILVAPTFAVYSAA